MASKTRTTTSDGFSVDQGAMAAALKAAKGVVQKTATMPQLMHVKLAVVNGSLQVQATDLTVSVVSTCPLADVVGDASMTIPATELVEVVTRMRTGDLWFEVAQRGWVQIRQQKTILKLPTGDAELFPKVMRMPEGAVDVSAPALLELIERTTFSVCKDETRFHLTGCMLANDGAHSVMVSTDGHRLTIARAVVGLTTRDLIIPLKGLLEIRRLIADHQTCSVGISDHCFVVEVNTTMVAVRLVDAQYPPYKQVIQKNRCMVSLDRRELLDSVLRLRTLVSTNSGLIFNFRDNAVVIAANGQDRGEGVDEVEAEISGAPPKQVRIDPRYLVDILERLPGDRTEIQLGAELDAVLVRDSASDSMIGIIMPMRI